LGDQNSPLFFCTEGDLNDVPQRLDLPGASIIESDILVTHWWNVGKIHCTRKQWRSYSNMDLYRTLFNAYGHNCITTVLGGWLL